jgi:hypothetical protein
LTFTLRGKVNVNIQWLLYCMIHNIEKIKNYGFAYNEKIAMEGSEKENLHQDNRRKNKIPPTKSKPKLTARIRKLLLRI